MISRWISAVAFLVSLMPVARAARADEDRGYLGVGLENVPDAVAHHLSVKGGAMIVDVAPGSPAEQGGLKSHDIVLSAAGESVKDREALKEKVRAAKPGDKLKLGLRRGTESVDVEVTLGSLAEAAKRAQGEEKPRAEKAPPVVEKKEKTQPGFLGVGFGDVPAILSEHLGLAEGAGIIVNDVWKDSPAQKAGIEKNDVLLALDGYEIKGPKDFAKLLGEKKAGDAVKVEIIHKGQRSTSSVTLSERPKELSDASDDVLWGPAQGEGPGGTDVWRLHRGPGPVRRGRVIIEGPNGKTWKVEVPDTLWDAQELSQAFEVRLKDLEKEMGKGAGSLRRYFEPEALSRRLKKLTEDLELQDLWKDADLDINVNVDSGAQPSGAQVKSSESHSSIVSVVENGLAVTVEDQNGLRTVTVKQDGKTIAENLPWEKLDTLPQDIRPKVEKVAEGIKPLPRPRPQPVKRIKA